MDAAKLSELLDAEWIVSPKQGWKFETVTISRQQSLLERSNAHVGSIVFDIIEKKERKLKGHYWTNRGTKGEVILEFYDKELFDEIPSQFENHPVTEDKHTRQ